MDGSQWRCYIDSSAEGNEEDVFVFRSFKLCHCLLSIDLLLSFYSGSDRELRWILALLFYHLYFCKMSLQSMLLCFTANYLVYSSGQGGQEVVWLVCSVVSWILSLDIY